MLPSQKFKKEELLVYITKVRNAGESILWYKYCDAVVNRFMIDNQPVCAEAHARWYGTTRKTVWETWGRVERLGNVSLRALVDVVRIPRNRSISTIHLMSWLRQFAKINADYNPTNAQMFLQSSWTKRSVYELYSKDIKAAGVPGVQ
ncbi:hypothetical protein HK102_011752, partial [Quaeritorhiza haematococci]